MTRFHSHLVVPLLLLMAAAQAVAADPSITSLFTHQGRWQNLEIFSALVCSDSDRFERVSAGLIYRQAAAEGISPASYSTIENRRQAATRRHPIRTALLGLEVAGWSFSIAWPLVQELDDRKTVSPAAQAIAPAITAAIRYTRDMLNREPKAVEFPGELLPLHFELPAGQCVVYELAAIGARKETGR